MFSECERFRSRSSMKSDYAKFSATILLMLQFDTFADVVT